MSKVKPLQFGTPYHVFNRGNNRETIFRSSENYRFFLQRYAHYIEPVAKTYAYNLLPNHFHFSIYVRTPDEQQRFAQSCQLVSPAEKTKSWQLLNPSKAFANLFTSYSMAFNRQYERSGSLFEKPFKRKPVTDMTYFSTLVRYIHQNAMRHGIVDNLQDWPWTSYDTMLKTGQSRLARDELIDIFGDRQAFIKSHLTTINKLDIEPVLLEDDD